MERGLVPIPLKVYEKFDTKAMSKLKSGLIVALIGIDGSGKSTVIEKLLELSYPSSVSGVKRMYFGNKFFLIPGLDWFFRRNRGKKGLAGAIAKGMAAVDIKFRAVPALIAKRRKNLVLCDRYYFDQQVGDPVATFTNNTLLKKLFGPFVCWMPVNADLTIYLKIDPEIAHSRQQGCSLDQEISQARDYDKLFQTVEVTVIDANNSVEQVVEDVTVAIMHKLEGAR